MKKLLLLLLLIPQFIYAEEIKIGLGAILSSELAVFGQNDLRSAQLYLKKYNRHNLRLIPEDLKINSKDGLTAFTKLVNLDQVDILIAAGTSNALVAAKSLIEQNTIPTIMASTGGSNIDQLSPWVFRIGNSDVLNGIQQADYFIEQGVQRVALVTELTEYTVDISEHFVKHFKNSDGDQLFEQNFQPGEHDFKSIIIKILAKKPQAIFIPTQTGVALGVFIKQLRRINKIIPVYTTMVAAPNPDAHRIAGADIIGVKYMDPVYDREGKYRKFEQLYLQEYGELPAVPFHSAAVLDSLELLQEFLDKYQQFDAENFRSFLTKETKNKCGYMGCYSLDSQGHSDLGFEINTITRLIN